MKPTQLAAQLFTCRNIIKTPTEIVSTLRRLREVGFSAVQVSGMGPIAEEELNTILDGEGLVCCATHEPALRILDEPQAIVERLKKLRCKFTAYPYAAGVDLEDEASVDDMIARLDAAGAVLAAEGLTLCYHNHNHEFRKIGNQTILERIFEKTHPANLQGEPDTYWIQNGGGDNVEWCERLTGRLPLIHLKDYKINSQNQPEYAEIGSGNLNFKKIIASAEKAGCQWFIIEQDECPGDPVDSLAMSFRYLVDNICH